VGLLGARPDQIYVQSSLADEIINLKRKPKLLCRKRERDSFSRRCHVLLLNVIGYLILII
jgi:hypothetical protein